MSRTDDLRAAKERRIRREIGDAIQIARQHGVGRGPCPKCAQKRSSLLSALITQEVEHGR